MNTRVSNDDTWVGLTGWRHPNSPSPKIPAWLVFRGRTTQLSSGEGRVSDELPETDHAMPFCLSHWFGATPDQKPFITAIASSRDNSSSLIRSNTSFCEAIDRSSATRYTSFLATAESCLPSQ